MRREESPQADEGRPRRGRGTSRSGRGVRQRRGGRAAAAGVVQNRRRVGSGADRDTGPAAEEVATGTEGTGEEQGRGANQAGVDSGRPSRQPPLLRILRLGSRRRNSHVLHRVPSAPLTAGRPGRKKARSGAVYNYVSRLRLDGRSIKVIEVTCCKAQQQGRAQEFSLGPKTESGCAATPSRQLRGLGVRCERPSAVRGRAPTTQRFSAIYSTQDGLS